MVDTAKIVAKRKPKKNILDKPASAAAAAFGLDEKKKNRVYLCPPPSKGSVFNPCVLCQETVIAICLEPCAVWTIPADVLIVQNVVENHRLAVRHTQENCLHREKREKAFQAPPTRRVTDTRHGKSSPPVPYPVLFWKARRKTTDVHGREEEN